MSFTSPTTVAGPGQVTFQVTPNSLTAARTGTIFLDDQPIQVIQQGSTAGGGVTSPPLLSLGTGTYQTTQTITVTNAMASAVMRYTLDGSAPDDADALVPANGEISITQSATLRVRAWDPGFAPSVIVGATYTLQPATPSISPGGGTYSTPQTVTLATTSPGVTLRYTLDGTNPTESSSVYAGPFGVSTTQTVKVRGFRTGWLASQMSSATLTFSFGTLATPSASPGGGLDGEPTPITLTASAGASIRYTLDGTDPTASSALYTTPLTFGEGTTVLTARAFQPDWTPSAVLSETYTVDLTAPTITASVWPAPSATGWHNTDVTITFFCSDANGIADCPEPLVMSQDGADQLITRTATDAVGHQASVNVTINVDRTPAEISLTAPTDGISTSSANVTLSATVVDALSGVTNATCNGSVAAVSNGQVECVVPLSPGRNSVVLFVKDAAGNGISSGVTVTQVGSPSAIRVDPASRTLVIGEFRTLRAMDDYGLLVTSPVWSSSDTDVATVDAAGKVIGITEGQATITATAGTLTAEAMVTVMAGPTLPYGTSQWTVAPTPGLQMQAAIYTHKVDATVPDLFAVETDATGSSVVRALTELGESMWSATAPGTPVLGDSFGGLIAELRDTEGKSRGFARFAGPSGTSPWRYESGGYIGDAAQATDGTIYSVEWISGNGTQGLIWDKSIVAINGQTGRVLSRIPIPPDQGCSLDWAPEVGRPSIGTDGYGYVQIRSITFPCGQGAQVTRTLKLLRVGPTGVVASWTLYTYQGPMSCGFDTQPIVGNVSPDGLGGILAKWERFQNFSCSTLWEGTITRFDKNGVRSDYVLSNPTLEVLLGGDDGTVHVQDPAGGPITVLDVRDWSTRWTRASVAGKPVAPLLGGGAAFQAANGTLELVDEAGATTTSALFPVSPQTRLLPFRMDAWQGIAEGVLNTFFGQTYAQALFGFFLDGGNGQRQFAANLYEGYGSNHNSIVLATAASPQLIFDEYIRTFAGVNAGTIGFVTADDGFPLTGVGQRLTFTLYNLPPWPQGPFQVEVSRYDSAGNTIAVHTVPPDHPLEGYRYWRVFQLEPGKVVVETGAVDLPATPADIPGFLVDKWVLGKQLSMWGQYLDHIREDLGATALMHPDCSHPGGRWDHPKDYILLNVNGPGTDRVCR